MDASEYYRLRYPYPKLVELLTCNGDELYHFEFAVEGVSPDGSEIYKRYVSASTAQELKEAVLRMPNVKTFHFGPIYTGKPEPKGKEGRNCSVPIRRVLSFDIDLTDYDWLKLDDAAGKPSLEKCDAAYPVSAIALYLLKRLLIEAFAFTKILMVYSGRRGVHVHVFDEAAMALSNEGRCAVACYLNNKLTTNKTLRSDDDVRRLVFMHNMKSTVYRLFETVVVGKMDLFGRLDARVDFVHRLEVEKYSNLANGTLLSLADDAMEPDSGQEAWEFIKQKVHGCGISWMADRLDAVVLAYVWPRLDFHVTAKLDHLTKVPFAAHGKSRRVSVAIDPNNIEGFDPASAPMLDTFDDDAMAAAVQRFRIAPTAAPARGLDPDDLGAVCDLEDLARAAPKRVLQPYAQGRERLQQRRVGKERKRSPLAP